MSKLYVPIRRVIYIALGALNAFLPFKNKVFILCYHGIGNDTWDFSVSLKTFKKQMLFLKKSGYKFVSLQEIEKHITGEKVIEDKAVSITFDDGYKDVLEIKDFVKKENIKPSMFVLSNTKKANRYELANQRVFLSKEDIRSLISDGWEIGSHTATHSNMFSLSDDGIVNEVEESKKAIERMHKVNVKYIAYPKGRYTKEVLNCVKKAGYKMGFSMDDGFINKNTDMYKVPRIGVDRTHSFGEFKVLHRPFVAAARSNIKKLII